MSKIQKPAILIGLIAIRNNDDILDLGCGTGHLTRKLRELTNGRIVGVDPAEGMIKEAIEKNKDLDITFEIKSAEEIEYKACFDVIFCNSAFQWFRDPQKALKIATLLYVKVAELESRHQRIGYIALTL